MPLQAYEALSLLGAALGFVLIAWPLSWSDPNPNRTPNPTRNPTPSTPSPTPTPHHRWNWVFCNTGYHNEHHTFPNVPGCYLPRITAAAPQPFLACENRTSW